MKTVREIVEENLNNSSADIYEIKNVKPTGIFYYETERLLHDYGGRFVENVIMIKGIEGHEAVLRMYLKLPEGVN